MSTSVADTTIALQCMILSFVAPPHIKETINATHEIDFAILFVVLLFIFDALKCVHCVGGLLMVRIADAHLTSTFLKVAFIVSVEGCRFKIKSHFPNLRPKLHRSRKFGCLAKFLPGLFWFMTQLFQISKKPVLHPSGQNLTKARP